MFLSGGASQENHIHDEKDREENPHGPKHVTEKARHLDAAFVHDRHRHKVRGVTDIGDGTHKDRAHRNGRQGPCVLSHQAHGIAARQVKEGEVGGRVIQKRRQRTREPEEHDVVEVTVIVRHQRDERCKRAVVTGSQHLKHRHDADKDTEKEFGDFGNRRPCELIGRTGNLGRSGKRQNRKEDKERVTPASQRKLTAPSMPKGTD